MALNNVKGDKIWLTVLMKFDCDNLEILILMNNEPFCKII